MQPTGPIRYDLGHLARMNRSGQRAGAVGSKPTVVTTTVLQLAHEGMISRSEGVFDLGAGKHAKQTAILRDAGFDPVTPYDVGKNDHGTPFDAITSHGVVMMSNVLNVQGSVQDVRDLLALISDYAAAGTVLVCNLPREPRYGNIKEQDVTQALDATEFTIRSHNRGVWVAVRRGASN